MIGAHILCTPSLLGLLCSCPSEPLEGAAAIGDSGDVGMLCMDCHLEHGPLATQVGALCGSLLGLVLVLGLGLEPGQVAEQGASCDSGHFRGP